MDCGQARTSTRKALCADAALGAVYGKLALPQQADALRQAQRGWLKQRNLRAADGDDLARLPAKRPAGVTEDARLTTAMGPATTATRRSTT